MSKLSRDLLALTLVPVLAAIAISKLQSSPMGPIAPELAQTATSTTPGVSWTPPVSRSTAAAPNTGMVDRSSATPAESKTLPGITPRRPYTDKHQRSRSTAAATKTEMVDLNSATAAELKPLPGISESDASKIIQGRPYTDKPKKVLSEAEYDNLWTPPAAR
jgi:competence protein ComEA